MSVIEPAKILTWGRASAIVRARRWEEDIAATIREWALRFPDVLVALDRIVKYQRQNNGYRRAWGGEAGKMEAGARLAEIPRTLMMMMNRRFGKSWLDKQDMLEAFFRHFKVGLINKNDRPRFNREH